MVKRILVAQVLNGVLSFFWCKLLAILGRQLIINGITAHGLLFLILLGFGRSFFFIVHFCVIDRKIKIESHK